MTELVENFFELSDDERMKLVVDYYPTVGRYELAKKADVGEKRARTFLANLNRQNVMTEVAKSSSRNKLVDDLLNSNLSDAELASIINSTKTSRPKPVPISAPIDGHFKALVFTDSHIGHKKFNEAWYYSMLEHAVKEKCDWAWHVGDILEGMYNRPGHVFELDCIGFEAQFSKAVRLFNDCPIPIRGITANHDFTFAGINNAGVDVGQRLQDALPGKFFYLGAEEADEVINGVRVKLWHGRDGASYATSYRCQKFIEQLSGGEKPHILLSGHAHKSVFFECRNVMAIEAGTLCAQTGFMRGKKLAAHTGYWILEVWTNKDGLARLKPEWVKLYE